VENKKASGLKRSSDFLEIQKKGKRKTLSPWLVLAFKKNQLGHLRYGCTISRNVGSAVTRNRLKRWTREYFRKAATDGFNPEFDFNLVFRPMSADFYKKLEAHHFFKVLQQVEQLFA
jgi:ribonuclease P protein component